MTELIQLETHNQIATLTLNRPERHNSLVPEFCREMLNALEEASRQSELRALVLQANGRSFSTGGDVKAFYDNRDNIKPYAREIVGLLNQVIVAMVKLPVPIVAAVHSIVTGGSLGLVLASDIVLVAPEASFTPFYSVVGYSPDGGWTAMLPSVIGRKRVSDILMLNQTISAEQAVQWGMANRIIAADRIRDEARIVAESIAQKKWGSIQRTKQLLWQNTNALAESLEQERYLFCEQIVTAEALNGMEAFLSMRTK
ncbi:MAG: enoyl-CoA hydratase/isomerase family protein [Chloroflexi bacterium]|nr:enoyl-CoA hydratase/isomerase family protein [Chloroflexota bacterium]